MEVVVPYSTWVQITLFEFHPIRIEPATTTCFIGQLPLSFRLQAAADPQFWQHFSQRPYKFLGCVQLHMKRSSSAFVPEGLRKKLNLHKVSCPWIIRVSSSKNFGLFGGKFSTDHSSLNPSSLAEVHFSSEYEFHKQRMCTLDCFCIFQKKTMRASRRLI